MIKNPTAKDLHELINGEEFLSIKDLNAGYGKMEILHDFNLSLEKGRSLCLIGPNGAGKSTVLHSIYGLSSIFKGSISLEEKNVTQLSPSEKLKHGGITYVLQDSSIFPDLTVKENLMMGAYIHENQKEAEIECERIFDKYERLFDRKDHKAKVLSGGERRLLEISRSLMMNPEVMLIDEPSIGLEPRFIDMVFDILSDLQEKEGKTILLVEQNAKKGLEFSDFGYVLVSGKIVMAGTGEELLKNEEVGRLFLGG